MSEVIIGFRSGTELTVRVNDCGKLIAEVVKGMRSAPSANVQWFHAADLLLNVSEITYIMPKTMLWRSNLDNSPQS